MQNFIIIKSWYSFFYVLVSWYLILIFWMLWYPFLTFPSHGREFPCKVTKMPLALIKFGSCKNRAMIFQKPQLVIQFPPSPNLIAFFATHSGNPTRPDLHQHSTKSFLHINASEPSPEYDAANCIGAKHRCTEHIQRRQRRRWA